jgi:3D-(3,5/4)-trihydroxycyclohexane-1,2-dione acylhydrolase (decyclizing)
MGDGVFLMTHCDIHTSLQEKKKLIIVVLDNQGFMCIRELQTGTGIPSFGTDFRYRKEGTAEWSNDYLETDYAAIARGYGAKGYTVRTMKELKEAFRLAQSDEITALIDIKVLADTWLPGYESWWRTGVPAASEFKTVEDNYKNDFLPNEKATRKY